MTDAYKNFIEFEAGTLPDTNVFYATIIATLNEQLKEANEIIKKCAEYCSVGCYYDERDEEMALDSKFYLKKWSVK